MMLACLACLRVAQAYNTAMKSALCTPSRLTLAAALAVTLSAAMAQTPAPAPTAQPAAQAASAATRGNRPDQTIQRIRTEDAGTRIDELRVGGQTEQVTVQPKTGGAAYEIKRAEGARGTPPSSSSGDTNGTRVWNALKF